MLEPALSSALAKEITLSFWKMLFVVAMRPLCCHACTMELSVTAVDRLEVQELLAHRQVKYVYTSIKKDFMEIKRF